MHFIFNGTGIIQGQRNYSIENSQILLIGWEMATISPISYVSGQKNPGVGKSCAQGWYLHILSLTLSKVQNQGMNPAEFFFLFLERIITCWEASLCSWQIDEHVYEWRIHAVHKVCQTFQICVLVHFKHLSLLPCVDFDTLDNCFNHWQTMTDRVEIILICLTSILCLTHSGVRDHIWSFPDAYYYTQ